MSNESYEEWVSVFSSGTDYEADLVRDKLDNAGLSAVVLSKRDHAFNLTIGDMAKVFVLVPPDQAEEARSVLDAAPFTDEELEALAQNADPDAPAAHTKEQQTMLDTGIDKISLSGPSEEKEG